MHDAVVDQILSDQNAHAVGLAAKELVRRAITTIRPYLSRALDAQHKVTATSADDVFTQADTEAQRTIMRSVVELWPRMGILGEESGGTVQGEDNRCFVSIDSLDGTKAFLRCQTYGMATMLAIIVHGEVECAYIGNVISGDVYGFRPCSPNTYRIYENGRAVQLGPSPLEPDRRPMLTRNDPLDFPLHQSLLFNSKGGVSKFFEMPMVIGSSIGTMFSSLWNNEVNGVLLHGGTTNVWDEAPVWGITKHLGYLALQWVNGAGYQGYDMGKYSLDQPQITRPDLLFIHQDYLGQLQAWQEANKQALRLS